MNANTRNQPEKILEHFLSTGKSSDNNGDLVTRQVFVWLFLFVCCWPQILFRKETFLNRATNQPINESINQTINDQSTIQPSNQPTNQSIYQPTNQPINHSNQPQERLEGIWHSIPWNDDTKQLFDPPRDVTTISDETQVRNIFLRVANRVWQCQEMIEMKPMGPTSRMRTYQLLRRGHSFRNST